MGCNWVERQFRIAVRLTLWDLSRMNRRPLPCHGESTTYGTDGKGVMNRYSRQNRHSRR
jgi:hypothetical protein